MTPFAGYEVKGVPGPKLGHKFENRRKAFRTNAELREATRLSEAIRKGQYRGLTLREIAKAIGADVEEVKREQLRWLREVRG